MASIIQSPQGKKLMVTGDYNADLAAPEGHNQDETIFVAMTT